VGRWDVGVSTEEMKQPLIAWRVSVCCCRPDGRCLESRATAGKGAIEGGRMG
jgi:hypothetical protein